MEKAGLVPATDLDGVVHVEAGQFFEPGVAAWANHRWRMGLRKVTQYLVHGRIDRFGASLDYEDGAGNPVEIKMVQPSMWAQHWAAEGDTVTVAPVWYLLQVQAQLTCRPEAEFGWLVPRVDGGNVFRMRVPRDRAVGSAIEEEVAAFWRSIDEGRRPDPDYTARPDQEILRRMSPEAYGTIDLSRSNRAAALCAEIVEAAAAEREAKARARAARAELNAIMGHAAEALVQGYRVKRAIIPAAEVAATIRESYPRLTVSQNRKA